MRKPFIDVLATGILCVCLLVVVGCKNGPPTIDPEIIKVVAGSDAGKLFVAGCDYAPLVELSAAVVLPLLPAGTDKDKVNVYYDKYKPVANEICARVRAAVLDGTATITPVPAPTPTVR